MATQQCVVSNTKKRAAVRREILCLRACRTVLRACSAFPSRSVYESVYHLVRSMCCFRFFSASACKTPMQARNWEKSGLWNQEKCAWKYSGLSDVTRWPVLLHFIAFVELLAVRVVKVQFMRMRLARSSVFVERGPDAALLVYLIISCSHTGHMYILDNQTL